MHANIHNSYRDTREREEAHRIVGNERERERERGGEGGFEEAEEAKRRRKAHMGGAAGGDPLTKGASSHVWIACCAAELATRTFAMLLSIAGGIVMAKNKLDIYYNIGGIRFLAASARYTDIEAFVYLVYANSIAAAYCFLSMPAIFLVERRHCINALLFFMDQALAFLLLGAAASSTEASYIAKRGESKTQWSEVCSTIEHFCTRVGVSLFLTFTAVLVFIALGIMSAKRLFGSSATCAPSCQLSAHA